MQFSHEKETKYAMHLLGYHAPRKGHPLEILIQPAGVTLPIDDDRDRVAAVACGRAHTLALTAVGDVFALGSNSHGQCGRPVVADEDYFNNRVVHRVSPRWNDGEDKVTGVVCGQDHR